MASIRSTLFSDLEIHNVCLCIFMPSIAHTEHSAQVAGADQIGWRFIQIMKCKVSCLCY